MTPAALIVLSVILKPAQNQAANNGDKKTCTSTCLGEFTNYAKSCACGIRTKGNLRAYVALGIVTIPK